MINNKIVLTGIKPTGSPHVGNLIGAINPVIELASQAKQSYVFIADLHALNALQDREKLEQNTREIASAFLAMGLDVEKTALFRQSDVHEVLALANILNNVTPKGMMNRSHAYKAVNDHNSRSSKSPDEGVNMGLYTYPILMAADILLYGVDVVPVGKDQKQHIEFTQEIARRFNNTFGGESLVIPEALIEKTTNAIPGLDGRKMSKSYGNTIPIFSNPDDLKRLVSRIITDNKGINEPRDPNEYTVFQLYKSFANDEAILAMRNKLEQGGMSHKEAKSLLFDAMNKFLEEPRKKFEYYMNNPDELDKILDEGANKARVSASAKLKDVTKRVLGRPMVMRGVDKENVVEKPSHKQGQNQILSHRFLARAGNTKVHGMKNRASSLSAARGLQLLARDLALKGEKQSIVLTTGLGLSDKGVPLRLPSLLMPGLNMLEELSQLNNIEVKYVVYQATSFIVDMNKLDLKNAFENANICEGYLKRFVEKYYPDLTDKVEIVTSDKVDLDSNHIRTLANRLANSQGTIIEDDMKIIEGYASRRKTTDNSHLYYAAANIILNGAYGPHYPMEEVIPADTSVIIPIGGRMEKPFFNITSFINEESNSQYKVFPIIVPVGKIPAYYPNRNGDILVNDENDLEGFVAPPEIQHDIAMLESRNISLSSLRSLGLG